jgi:hypothetical protein
MCAQVLFLGIFCAKCLEKSRHADLDFRTAKSLISNILRVNSLESIFCGDEVRFEARKPFGTKILRVLTGKNVSRVLPPHLYMGYE